MEWIVITIGDKTVLIVDGIPLVSFVGGVCYMLLTKTVNTILYGDKPVDLIDQFMSFVIWKRKDK